MSTDERKHKTRVLLEEFLSDPPPSEERDLEILAKLQELLPDPNITDYIFYSNEFENKDGSIDIDALIEKCLRYKPNIIAL